MSPSRIELFRNTSTTPLRRLGFPTRGLTSLGTVGCRRIYNEHPDEDVAQQLLGNVSKSSTRIYAVRQANALTKVAAGYWEKYQSAGRNWSQTQKGKTNVVNFQERKKEMAGEAGFEPANDRVKVC